MLPTTGKGFKCVIEELDNYFVYLRPNVIVYYYELDLTHWVLVVFFCRATCIIIRLLVVLALFWNKWIKIPLSIWYYDISFLLTF